MSVRQKATSTLQQPNAVAEIMSNHSIKRIYSNVMQNLSIRSAKSADSFRFWLISHENQNLIRRRILLVLITFNSNLCFYIKIQFFLYSEIVDPTKRFSLNIRKK